MSCCGPAQEIVVKIDLNAIADRQKHRRTPLNLAVVLDKSGSMTGAKLEKAKQAATQLVDRLAPSDVFSLVIYSDEARVLVPAQKVEDKESLKEKIESIEAGGSTALHAGVKTGAARSGNIFPANASTASSCCPTDWRTSAPAPPPTCAGSDMNWPNRASPSPPSASATITTRT